jgi:hypothetical protein
MHNKPKHYYFVDYSKEDWDITLYIALGTMLTPILIILSRLFRREMGFGNAKKVGDRIESRKAKQSYDH